MNDRIRLVSEQEAKVNRAILLQPVISKQLRPMPLTRRTKPFSHLEVDPPHQRAVVERGIVCQNVDDLKTTESRKQMSIDGSLLEVLKVWKQTTQSPTRMIGCSLLRRS